MKKENSLNNRYFSTKGENNKQDFNSFFDLAKPNLKFLNVEKEYNNILNSLDNLKKSNKSGIYLFWLLDNHYKCYLGSAIYLKRRFNVHFKEAMIKNKHPKFYAAALGFPAKRLLVYLQLAHPPLYC